MATEINTWPKKITVDRKIVQTLSGATYDSFPKSIKELIINSYDGLASEVTITIDLNAEILTVEDNGIGMTNSDFDFYIRIAGSTRSKESSAYNHYSRPKVGKFGIGFLSTFPFFQNFYIESKKRNSQEYLYANIPCYKYFDSENKLTDVSDIPISGGIRIDNKQKDRQFTKVVLSGFTNLSWAFFNEDYNIKGRRDTILKYKAIQRLKWELSEDLPVSHIDNRMDEILKFNSEQLPFRVFLNRDEIFRQSYGTAILEQSENFENIGNIKFKYFIATSYEPISPVESRYLKIRNLNVGVGARETFGIGLEGRLYSKLAWLTGEINVSEGLNDLIAASRDKFNYSPDFEDFKEFFREKLRKWASNIEEVNDLQKDVTNMHKSSSVKSIKDISNKSIEKQVIALKKKGFTVRQDIPSPNQVNPISIDKDSNEIVIYSPIADIEKKLQIGDKTYILKEEKWDHEKDPYPACKIINDTLIINSNYPLFNKSIFDTILKLQVIILNNHLLGFMDITTFTKIQTEITKTFL